MITATYSPEDNKIRLYPSTRLDAETYAKVKAAGYVWAPKQELFVAPKWTTGREDLALELAGEIEPEGMTLAERAQMKAERLDDLAARTERKATAYQQAAQDISERFYMGQPILVGHHSERKARKDKDRMDGAQRKAIDAHKMVAHWLYKAEGAEAHANYKNDPKVRARRIETLLAELRDEQRDLNFAHKALAVWEKATTDALITHIVGNANFAPYGVYGDLSSGKITPTEARDRCMKAAHVTISSNRRARTIAHILNRLSYEREMLGDVSRHSGPITPTMLQIFLRTHGADKPQATKVDDDLFAVECDAPLPAHIALGSSVEMSGDEWRDLMQACGYEVPAKKDALPPILNFKATSGTVEVASRASYRGAPKSETLRQVEMTAAEYKKQGDSGWIIASACREYRVRTATDPAHKGPYYMAPRVAVFLTDSKAHPIPASISEAIE